MEIIETYFTTPPQNKHGHAYHHTIVQGEAQLFRLGKVDLSVLPAVAQIPCEARCLVSPSPHTS